MAFSADELRVLRRALEAVVRPALVPEREVRACRRLARAVDQADGEAARRRAFLVADLRRYRAALPGSARGYLESLDEALSAGCPTGSEDLASLRRIAFGAAGSTADRQRARRLLDRLSAAPPAALPARREGSARHLLVVPSGLAGGVPVPSPPYPCRNGRGAEGAAVPGSRPAADGPGPAVRAASGRTPAPGRAGCPAETDHIADLRDDTDKDGGEHMAAKESDDRERTPRPAPAPGPKSPGPSGPRPTRPVPTPGEVFPPRRRPKPPPGDRSVPPEEHLRTDALSA